MAARFTTIGHSNRNLAEFRAFPRSRTNPAFNSEWLEPELARLGIGYCHCSALGGRRKKQNAVDPELNALWRVQSFHNYADYALSEEFDIAFQKLMRLGEKQRIALMCSEAVWWRCHRRIITDYLLLNGHAVDHLMAPGKVDAATPTPGARRTDLGKVVYPAGSARKRSNWAAPRL
jgi:uncharacterized protein (DUF488 family)